jgi:glutamate/tyrosine decarboxylase-like PLP-dependent enzyme
MQFPKTGMTREAIANELEAKRSGDADWRAAKTWSLVYHARDDVLEVVKDAYMRFFSENALNPMAFPSLRRCEREVVAMSASLFHAPDGAAGSMTSGGSESLLMAVKTARDWARAERPGVREPEMLLPITAHPALEKAAHYFGVKAVHVPVDASFRADARAARELVSASTILVVGSAPAYPHGVVDPLADLAALAEERGILCHVDACLGGFLLPFAEKLGRPIPPFDFRVKGVTSMSADIHKYGYAAKGASLVLYRSRALRRHQYFAYADWPGGLYGSPSMTGTRPGGAIAAAWAAIRYLGEEGYLALARTTLETTDALARGIVETPGLRLVAPPDLSVLAFTSDATDVYVLGEQMETCGWKLDRQQRPPCLHLMVTPSHARIVEPFLADLRACVKETAETKTQPEGAAAMYGMLGAVPDRSMVDGFILDFMDGLDRAD